MQKLFITFFLTATLLLLTANTNIVQAFSCTSCSADPATGPLTNGFSVNGNGCTGNSNIISVAIYNSVGEAINAFPITLNNGSFSVDVPAPGEIGTFEIVLTDAGGAPTSCGTYNAEAVTPPPGGGDSGLQCGSITATYSTNCPTDCPSRLHTATQWICGCGVDGEKCCPTGNQAGNAQCIESGSSCNGNRCYAAGSIIDISVLLQGSCQTAGTIETAIGCVPYNFVEEIVAFFLTWGFGIGGGFVILIVIVAGFQIITSSGDPTKLQSGQSLLVSAVSGLVMLVFSIFLLRLIGVNVLGLF